MTRRRLQFESCSLKLPPGWRQSRDPDGLLTLVKQDGFGALQFSFAHYKSTL